MCGIAGIVGKHSAPLPDELDAMMAVAGHRGPDDQGTWREGNVALGHRRLTILDLSPAGRQPLVYMDRYVLVFNGEIYNYLELRRELTEKGYRFDTATDSEVIPAAYDCWGEACQLKMNGMWAFCLFDREKKTLFCSRDRYGIKPFYYYDGGERFAFASEIKQLLPVKPDKPRVNRTALELFLAGGYLDYSEQTMFTDVYQLKGGHCLTCDAASGKIEIRRWFQCEQAAETGMDAEECAKVFRARFQDSVNRHLRADVEIGSCLSGGLDSSAIVCEASRQLRRKGAGNRQQVITSCFDSPAFDERRYSHLVLDACPNVVPNEVFPDMDAALNELGKMVWHMDEPFASSSIYAQWVVYHKARALGLKVMLDGQGADELLCGYHDFFKSRFAWLLRRGRWGQLVRETRQAFDGTLRMGKAARLRFLAVALAGGLLPDGLYDAARRLAQRLSPSHNWLCMSREGLDALCAVKRRLSRKDPRSYANATLEIGLPALLHYEDRNSMACSVEARLPFLDADFAEFVSQLPMEMKLRDGTTKWILRKALAGDVPEGVLARRDKMGFVTPESLWIAKNRAELRERLRDAARELAPLVDEERLMRWYDGIKTFSAGDSTLWRIICAAEWKKVFGIQWQSRGVAAPGSLKHGNTEAAYGAGDR